MPNKPILVWIYVYNIVITTAQMFPFSPFVAESLKNVPTF